MRDERASGKPILILRTGETTPGVAATRGQFRELIATAIGDAFAGPYEEADPRTDAPLPDSRGFAAVIITGSAASVADREPWVLRAEAWLREVVAAGTPTLGICFGHQLLAQALGGEVQRNPRGREIGTVEVERVGDDPLLEGLGSRFHVNATHVDTAVRLPPGAVRLARAALEDSHLVRFGERCYGMQYHPEVDRYIMLSYLEQRGAILAEEGFDVPAMRSAATDAPEGRGTLVAFIRRFVAT